MKKQIKLRLDEKLKERIEEKTSDLLCSQNETMEFLIEIGLKYVRKHPSKFQREMMGYWRNKQEDNKINDRITQDYIDGENDV